MSARLGITVLLTATLFASVPNVALADGALAAGDHFSVEINYSNSWEEVAILVPGRARPQRRLDAAALAQMRAEAFASAVPIAEDPLFVDMILHAKVLEGGVLQVKPEMTRVHYHDDRGRRWTIDPKKADARELAEKLVDDLSFAWRRDFRSRLEREMLEEQLLGAALVLLDGAEFEVQLDRGEDPIVKGLDKAMSQNVPDSFPSVLRDSVNWFFREAVTRISAPTSGKSPGEVTRGAKFVSGGMPFKVVKTGKKWGQKVVVVEGYVHRIKVGVSTREHAVYFPNTGLVLEGQVTTFHETVGGASNRFGSVKWASRLLELKRGHKSEGRK